MFGYWLVKKGDWFKYQNAFHRIGDLHRWLAGFKDLDLLWGWLYSPDRSIDELRTKYARMRKTNVYGLPLDIVRMRDAEKIVDMVLDDPLLSRHESQRLAQTYRERYGHDETKKR